MDNIYKEYCTGCGICESLNLTKLINDEKGFLYPERVDGVMKEFCDQVCPMGGNSMHSIGKKTVWGNFVKFGAGYATDEYIRKKASSGGVLTSLCCWLINNNIVDAIIQTSFNDEDVTDTKTVISCDKEKIINCSGSRYSKSSPLKNIVSIVSDGRKYAFVGKPCDVIALTNYMKIEPSVRESILYTFSFFCAGTPSQTANEKLLKELGVNKNECRSLSYRGNGWPGYTTVVDYHGNEHTMHYQKAWMDILGRDIRLSCKFCFDSIGERSDISCGDFWYLNDKGEPDFSERQGRNCVFAWSERGKALLEIVERNGKIVLEKSDLRLLNKAQPNHFNRRSTLFTKIMILKAVNCKTPAYPLSVLFRHMRFNTIIAQCRAAKGTIQRIAKGKI